MTRLRHASPLLSSPLLSSPLLSSPLGWSVGLSMSLLVVLSIGCRDDRPMFDNARAPSVATIDDAVNVWAPAEDPNIIAYMGHGTYFNALGYPVEPTLERITLTQDYYIDKLSRSPAAKRITAPSPLEPAGLDPVLSKARYLDELIEAVQPKRLPYLVQVSASMREHYRHTLYQGDGIPEWHPPTLAPLPGTSDVRIASQGLRVETKDNRYRDQCISEGVPVPESIILGPPRDPVEAENPDDFPLDYRKDRWVNHGFLDKDFVNGQRSSVAELWSYESSGTKGLPEGICLALPRWEKEIKSDFFSTDVYQRSGRELKSFFSGRAEIMGVICLGRVSNKACFFDTKNGQFVARPNRGDELFFNKPGSDSVKNLLGGTSLFDNGGGVCSDCHAGQNPFVIHPHERAFQSLVTSPASRMLNSKEWYEPLVPGNWEQNPGPIPSLGPVGRANGVRQQPCDGCHVESNSGQFPNVFELPNYCVTVLRQAVNGNDGRDDSYPTPIGPLPLDGALKAFDPTMPALPNPVPSVPAYKQHADWLLRACSVNRSNSKGSFSDDVPFDEKPIFLSKVEVVSPVYACSATVGVRGAKYGATIELYVNNVLVETQVGRNTDVEEVELSVTLNPGDKITAIQRQGQAESDPSDVVAAIKYQGPLPAPVIDGLPVYQCASRIAVSHVPGARLTVYRNDADALTTPGLARGRSAAWAKGPFEVGDELVAMQSLCEADSPKSEPVRAVAAPATIPPLSLDSFFIRQGQRLLELRDIVRGAELSVQVASFNPGIVPSWPYTILNKYDVSPQSGPLQEGQVVTLEQTLCETSKATEVTVLPCRRLDAPEIWPPLVGDQVVYVSKAEPDATIQVWRTVGSDVATREKIGDGAGQVIRLNTSLRRTDQVWVVQERDGCLSVQSYVTPVLGDDPSVDLGGL